MGIDHDACRTARFIESFMFVGQITLPENADFECLLSQVLAWWPEELAGDESDDAGARQSSVARLYEKSIAPRRSRLSFWTSPALAIALAAVLVLAIGISSAMFVRRTAPEQAVAQLLDMHVAALASPNPVDVVSTDRHTVKPWFQGKLPFTFNLPELAGTQYSLRGGRLVYFRGNPGAQLIYELGRHELSVFIVQDPTTASAHPAGERRNGFSTESWATGSLRYVVMSDAGAPDVHTLGDMVRTAQK